MTSNLEYTTIAGITLPLSWGVVRAGRQKHFLDNSDVQALARQAFGSHRPEMESALLDIAFGDVTDYPRFAYELRTLADVEALPDDLAERIWNVEWLRQKALPSFPELPLGGAELDEYHTELVLLAESVPFEEVFLRSQSPLTCNIPNPPPDGSLLLAAIQDDRNYSSLLAVTKNWAEAEHIEVERVIAAALHAGAGVN